MTKRMCAEFTNYMRTKDFMEKTEEYLPRFISWVNEKIIFWQTDLGSNLLPKT